MPSVALESFRASLELGLVDLQEKVVEFRGVDEVIADQRGEEWQH